MNKEHHQLKIFCIIKYNVIFLKCFILLVLVQACKFESTTSLENDSSTLSNCFVSYYPTGCNGEPLIIIYMRYPETAYFAGYQVGCFVDTSAIVYSDQYRIIKADEYFYNGHMMLSTGNNIMAFGESECVYKVSGKADFTGGVHGDELLMSISFLLDNSPIDFEGKTVLIPCEQFAYHQKTTTHESAISDNGIISPNPDHPVETIHVKHTIFKNVGYETTNQLIWQKEVAVEFWYHGIASISKSNGTSFFSESDSILYHATGNNAFLINSADGARTIVYKNEDTGLSAKVSSRLIQPQEMDSLCTLRVWDTEHYSKYYRSFTPLQNPGPNEVWESTMSVYHFRD